jgi:hypothetical protein
MTYSSIIANLAKYAQASYEVTLSNSLTGANLDKNILLHSDLLRLECLLAESSSDARFIQQLIYRPRDLDQLLLGKSVSLNRIIFKRLVSRCLEYISNTLECPAIFSDWDHYLFHAHIQTQDSPEWFREAFWDINVHAINLASKSLRIVAPSNANTHSKLREGPIVFIFKGPPVLAHYFNLRAFINSAVAITDASRFRVIFLDVPKSDKPNLPCKIFCLGGLPLVEKIMAYLNILTNTNAASAIWVASVQNLGLYMFSRIWPVQGYWSMKYHSIYAQSIDTYFKTSTTADRHEIDGMIWNGVPAQISDLLFEYPLNSANSFPQRIAKWLNKDCPLPVLTLGRQIKISNEQYGSVANSLISSGVQLSYSGRNLVPWHHLVDTSLSHNLLFLGWLSEHEFKKYLRESIVYLDSFPFGGGHTCFAALSTQTPILMLESDENRRCSFMMHLLDIAGYLGHNVSSSEAKEALGIYSEPVKIRDFILSISKKSARSIEKLSRIQSLQLAIFTQWTSASAFESELKRSVAAMQSSRSLVI